MAELKTKENDADVGEFLASVEGDQKRTDCRVLDEIMTRVTGEPARMWGTSIVGYGRYHFKYESGRDGEWLMTGFAPRKQNLVVYVMPGYRFGEMAELLGKLGKHKLGKSCLYIKRLSDVDLPTLEAIVAEGVRHMREKYPEDV